MNLDDRFDKFIYPKIWIPDCPKIRFNTAKYNIQIDRITYTPPQSFIVANHSHPIYEFHYCMSGEGKVIINNTDYELKAGYFFITGPHIFHSQLSPEKNCTEEFSFMANIEPMKILKNQDNSQIFSDMDNIFDIITNNKAYFGKDLKNAGQTLKSIYDYMQASGNKINLSQCWLLIMQTFLHTAQNIMPLPNISEHSSYNNLDFERLSVLDDIFRGYHPEISQDDVANRLGVSVRQLNRITMKYWGLTFKQKYINSRMEIAVTLLEHMDMLSIDEIAQKLNFSSQQYFSNVFKKYYGVSPNEYKKMCKIKNIVK